MPKIKLFKTYNSYGDEDESILQELSTGWQDITDEELQYLKDNIYNLFNNMNIRVVIYEDVTKEYVNTIDSLKDFIQKDKDKKEAEKQKRLEKDREKKLKAEKLQIAKARKLLEEKGLL